MTTLSLKVIYEVTQHFWANELGEKTVFSVPIRNSVSSSDFASTTNVLILFDIFRGSFF